MINWIKDIFSRSTLEEKRDEVSDEADEKFAPVGVRVRPQESTSLKPADTHVSGYNVDETVPREDDEFAATVTDLKTIGVDPYNASPIEFSLDDSAVPGK